MFKVAIIGLLASQAALADYSCSFNLEQTLTVKELNEKEVIVVVKNKTKTEKFEGILVKSEDEGTLNKTFDYELVNGLKEPAQLFIWYTPRFGRGCGRACQKSLPIMISANFTKDGVKSSYVCSKTTL